MTTNRPLTEAERAKLTPFWKNRPMHLLRLKTIEANR